MGNNDFLAIVPRIKVWETSLLNKSFYNKLLDCETYEDVLRILQETQYSYISESADFESALDDVFIRKCEEIKNSIKNKDMVSFICLKNDYHNVKTLIKSKVLNRDFSYILKKENIVSIKGLMMAIEHGDFSGIPDITRKAIEESFRVFELSDDSQDIDIVVDEYMFKHMKYIIDNMENKYMNRYFELKIDFTNIMTILRLKRVGKTKDFAKKVYLNGGKIDLDSFLHMVIDTNDGMVNRLNRTDYIADIKETIVEDNLSELERIMEDYLMKIVREARFVGYGIEPVFAYLYALEVENKNLRLILSGKLNSVDVDILRKKVREAYV